jgi:hypothetical protein
MALLTIGNQRWATTKHSLLFRFFSHKANPLFQLVRLFSFVLSSFRSFVPDRSKAVLVALRKCLNASFPQYVGIRLRGTLFFLLFRFVDWLAPVRFVVKLLAFLVFLSKLPNRWFPITSTSHPSACKLHHNPFYLLLLGLHSHLVFSFLV